MPKGTPIAIASAIAFRTSSRFSAVNWSISLHKSERITTLYQLSNSVIEARQESTGFLAMSLAEFVRRRDCFQTPIREQRDLGSEQQGLAHVVSNEDGGFLEILPQGHKLLLQF